MKLHIGGEKAKDGWKILNIASLPDVDFVGDISDLSIFEEDSCTDIYASHVFEHIPYPKAIDTLKGIKRILKPGGSFYVSVPDLGHLCSEVVNQNNSIIKKFECLRMIFGGQINENDFHYFGYDQQILFEFLVLAGFSSAHRVATFNLFNDTSEYRYDGALISLNVVAIK